MYAYILPSPLVLYLICRTSRGNMGMTNSAYSESRLGRYPELPHLRLDTLKLFLVLVHYLLHSSVYSDRGLGSCSKLRDSAWHQAPQRDAQHPLQGRQDQSVADVGPCKPVFPFSFEPCRALYVLPCLCNACLMRLRAVNPYRCGAMWDRRYGGGGQGREVSDPGILFFPSQTEEISSWANGTVEFVLPKQRTSMVVTVRTKLRGACRTLGSGATALHAVSAMLPKTCPLPSIVFWGKSCGSNTPLPSLSIAQSV